MDLEKLKIFIIDKLEQELSEKLSYHGAHHTLDVLKACEFYAKKMDIPDEDANLLFTAALMHDTGFIKAYDNHEESSIEFARKILPEWNYSQKDIEIIAGIIRATKIPQQPTTLLEEIMADSDLDYLGTNFFNSIGETLYKELLAFNKISTRKQWNEIQFKFLKIHKFHTPYAQKHREPKKLLHLNEIQKKLK